MDPLRLAPLCVFVLSALAPGARADELDFGGPDAGFFAGRYEISGHDGGSPPQLVLGQVVLTPDGSGLVVGTCGTGGHLAPDRFGDARNLLHGTIDGRELWCAWYSDLDNYPLIACTGADTGSGRARLVLWPDHDGFGEVPICN